ncbi:hypothetical protein D9V37_12880 [Nocardioides mangrovicus]|uniref:Mechanosensitive ion channel n=1 Tax=Nocardioides mangrovicus TaxID=2478913 RepID=A0A3L8NZM3_9ACTN|nr:mechanosensitive ion channel [Nocardioides mangrovicus]RLV48635.1 hypothetical protein D9V37_12880 [Nocardioides mangrovicus]
MTVDDFDFPQLIIRVVAAAVILLATWLIARLIKGVLTKQLERAAFIKKQGKDGETLAESLGTIASLVVWLLGLVAVLNLFRLTQVVSPIQDFLSRILAVLPGVIGAALILFIGFVLAKIVRQLVEVSLRTAGADRWLARLTDDHDASPTGSAAGTTSSSPQLSSIAGQLAFGLIMIVVAISALQVLGIRAISEPATSMLQQILDALPRILAAAVLLGIGYFVGRLVAPILESTLRGLGVDRSVSELGLNSSTPPSTIVARIVHVAIVLFFAIAATRVLDFPEVTNILNTVLAVAGRVVFGAAVIAAGVVIANVVARLVEGRTGTYLRWVTIALFVAIGLRSMGLADSIVNLAFGSVVVGAAAAAALAFGLGGRDAAARELDRLQSRTATPGTATGGAGASGDGPVS